MDETENERWKRVMGDRYHLPNLTPAPPAKPSGNPMGIRAKPVREDAPKFRREYSAALTEGVKISVTMRTISGLGRYGSGELTQANGRWILFDPKRIADKILDPRLVPLVEAACEAIFDMDRDWLRTSTNEFTDEKGAVWRRA